MAFNIAAKFSLQDSTTLHLVDPDTGEKLYDSDDETKPFTIDVYGPSSKQYRNWLAAAQRKADKESKQNGGKPKVKSPDEQLADTADFLAQLSIKASNFDTGDGPIATKEAFVELYSNVALMWIVEQVAKVLGEPGAFLQK